MPVICPQCGWKSGAERKDRSNNQNRYYWGIVIDILSNHTGFSRDEMHDVLKYKFLQGWKQLETKVGIIEVDYVKSTRDLSTKEFEDYLGEIRIWASADLNCSIPEPNEPPLEGI